MATVTTHPTSSRAREALDRAQARPVAGDAEPNRPPLRRLGPRHPHRGFCAETG
jgi:hypothetical protein